jgi:hypothetical protein
MQCIQRRHNPICLIGDSAILSKVLLVSIFRGHYQDFMLLQKSEIGSESVVTFIYSNSYLEKIKYKQLLNLTKL